MSILKIIEFYTLSMNFMSVKMLKKFLTCDSTSFPSNGLLDGAQVFVGVAILPHLLWSVYKQEFLLVHAWGETADSGGGLNCQL